MSNLQSKLERAQRDYDKALDKVTVAGPIGMSAEKVYQNASKRLFHVRDTMIAQGEWDKPIPLKP